MRQRRLLIGGLLLLVALLIALALALPYLQPPQQAEPPPSPSPSPEAASPLGIPAGERARVTRGDWWEVAFNETRYPDDTTTHRGGLDERLVALLDRAQDSIDIAIYDFDLANVAQALARASQRGVQVRMVTDSDTVANRRDEAIQAALETIRQAGIRIVEDQRSDLMHHKFTVVDGEWVQTGSWNYTDGDTYRLNNNQFIARSPRLAANYRAEFEKMFAQRRFGNQKPAGGTTAVLSEGGVRVENYFAPQDGAAGHLIDAIEQHASRRLSFLAFSFTHDGIAQAVLDRASAGVAVSGVFETTGSNTQFSEYGKFKQAGLDVHQDGNPYVMHHKVFVLDGQRVAFGSFNFSSNADTGNDENLLIVEDPRLAEAFQAEYERVVSLAKNPPPRQR